jgi:hypothetical protein
MRRWIPIVMIIVMVFVMMPVEQTKAQGVFGCPLPDQQDCDLLIAAVENTSQLQAVNVDNLALGLLISFPDNINIVEISANGPTVLDDEGDVSQARWDAALTSNEDVSPFKLILKDGSLYVDVQPSDETSDWLAIDPSDVGAGDIVDLTFLFNTLNFRNLVDVLNDIGEGVVWTRGPDTDIKGEPGSVFFAEFSTATLVQTSYFYEQVKVFIIDLARSAGLGSLDEDTTSFIIDFFVDVLADELGAANFRVKWVIGQQTQSLYALSIDGRGDIDLSVLAPVLELGPEEAFSYTVNVNVNLSQHNLPVAVEVPENRVGAGAAAFDGLLQLLLDLIFGGQAALQL